MNRKAIATLVGFLVASRLTFTAAPPPDIQLNQDSLRFAEQLIEHGHLVADHNGHWHLIQPSADEEDAYIRVHGWAEYAKWHLAIDPRHREKSKARYKFPFGDFKKIHRSALIAIRSRAGQYSYSEIENVAAELQRKLEAKAKSAK